MSNINIFSCPLNENIIIKVLSEQPVTDTVFFFPNDASKHIALKKFQNKWQFSQTLFLTMEELKELCFLTEKPLLKEEKRTLAFYASLTKADKKIFRINNYFQSIELARHFFDLWEEFNEELIYDKWVLQAIEQRTELFDWQKTTFNQLVAVKSNYRKYINEKDFEDTIFLYNKNLINFQYFEDYNNFVVVNQYYYTRLEKELITGLADLGKTVNIYHQHFEENSEADVFSTRPIFFQESSGKDYRTKKINIIECKNEFSMITSLIDYLHKNKINHIVDQSFQDKPYARFVAMDKFNLNFGIDFTSTSIYRFFHSLYKLIDSLIYDPQEKNELLPIEAVLNAVVIDEFFYFVIKKNQPQSIRRIQEQTLDYLYFLIENDFQYFDLQKKYEKLFPQNVVLKSIETLIDFINSFKALDTITSLIDKIDESNNVISVENIITENEFYCSNIKETFFQAVGDFLAIEKLSLVKDWKIYFEDQKDKNETLSKTSGLLRLFVDYLKAKKVKLNYKLESENNQHRIAISNLEDTRNISFDKVAVLNVTKDVIPSSRKTQFLFTEKQRQTLGLKSYEEIWEREKYYFFRMLLNSEAVYLFTLKNVNKNLERSSFLEEILLYMPGKVQLDREEVEDKNYCAVYDYFLNCSNYQVCKDDSHQANFFQFPLNKRSDFPENSMDVTPYSLAALLENPFVFYIAQQCGLVEKIKKVQRDFSSKLIGNIVHDVINEIWTRLIELEHGPIFGYDFSKVNDNMIKSVVNAVLGRHENYYKFPKNYSQTYFNEIIIPVFVQGSKEFFQRLNEKIIFESKTIEVIPEKEYGNIEEKGYKLFIPANENDLDLNVRIRGRADLRIKLQDEDFYLIFDYKTGGADKTQLLIYELYYYLIKNPEKIDQINSYFYHVFDAKLENLKTLLKKKSKQEKINQLRQDIIDAVNKIAVNGFDLPELKSKLGAMADVSRKDLYLPLMKKL